MADFLQFKRGQLAGLKDAAITPGTIYITTDERAMYVDYTAADNSAKRMRLGDYVEYATLNELTATGSEHLSKTAFYFVNEGNMLLRWTGDNSQGHQGFVQINPDTVAKIESVTTTVAQSNTNEVTITTAVKDDHSKTAITATKAVTIKGSEGATVTADADNNAITIEVNAINADSHYTPAYDAEVDFKVTDTKQGIDAVSAEVTETVAANKKVRFVSGVNVDKNGHVVGIGYDTIADTHGTVEATELTAATSTNGATITNNVRFDGKNAATQGSVELAGEGATTISAASNGKIVIASTDKSVDSAENHYKATTGTSVTATGNDVAAGVGEDVKVLTDFSVDAAGHVVNATYATVKDTHASPSATTMNVSTATNGAAINVTVTDSNNKSNATANSMNIVGDGATTVSVDGTTVKISSADSKVTSAANHYDPQYSADATVESDGSSVGVGETVAAITAIKLDAKGHVTGAVTTNVKDTHGVIEEVVLAPTTGEGFTATVKYDGKDYTSAALNPVIKIGSTNSEVKFVNGVADLDVYTTQEVQDLITDNLKAANAMTFIGSLDVDAATESDSVKKALPTANVNAGDTWIVATAGTYGGKTANVGDLFIAYNDVAEGSGNENWAYVPSGNDEAPQLTGADNKIQLGYRGTPDSLGSVEVKAAENCGITTNVANNVMTIGFEWGTF